MIQDYCTCHIFTITFNIFSSARGLFKYYVQFQITLKLSTKKTLKQKNKRQTVIGSLFLHYNSVIAMNFLDYMLTIAYYLY